MRFSTMSEGPRGPLGSHSPPWRLADSDPANRERLKGIVGFELRADAVQVKLKLNQNHAAANVTGAIEGLRRTGSVDAAAVAALMQTVLERR